MAQLQKRLSLINKSWSNVFSSKGLLVFAVFLLTGIESKGQVANYVNNGGFELCANCTYTNQAPKPSHWNAIDTTKFFGVLASATISPYLVPLSSYTYQWPKEGSNYFGTSLLYKPHTAQTLRGYPRNTLKQTLQAGATYCVKLYYNITNQSTYGSDGLGIFFGDNSTDTITYCMTPIDYLNPQIANPTNNLLTDTLNWSLLTGTFTALGTEKYMILGNFKSDAMTNTVLINPANLPTVATDFLFDNVSCIDIDLPADAGPDKWCIPGDSVFIGRQPDVGIDEACMWYKLPDMQNAIDTVAGLWVKPVVTTTYVVKQEICAGIKYDTVVVHQSATGLVSSSGLKYDLVVFPNPASTYITVRAVPEAELSYVIKDIAGKEVLSGDLNFKDNVANLNSNLENGVYLITVTGTNGSTTKKIIINK